MTGPKQATWVSYTEAPKTHTTKILTREISPSSVAQLTSPAGFRHSVGQAGEQTNTYMNNGSSCVIQPEGPKRGAPRLNH